MSKPAITLLVVCCFVAPVTGQETETSWSQFRGPQGNGSVPQAVPTEWSADDKVQWTSPIPGGGWSSPVVASDRVFVTTAVSKEFPGPKGFGDGVASMRSFFQSKPPQEPMSFEVHCLNLSDGKPLWKQVVASQKPAHKIHPSNSYATESPATDGKRVYTYFAAVGLVTCFDLEGTKLWSRELGAYPTSSNFGTGSSLSLDGKHLFVQCDNEEKSFVVALNTETGEDQWRVERAGRTSWSSPLVWHNRVRKEVVVCGSDGVTSYHPETGATLWQYRGRGGAFSASPTADSQRIYFGQSGRNSRGPLIAVNAGAEGELTAESLSPQGVAWTVSSAAPGMCSPVVVGERLFVLSRGIISCHNATDGERIYRSRLRGASSVTASLWAAGDKVYALNESGATSVIAASDTFDVLNSNAIPGLYWSTPAISGNAILLREAGKLHCIRDDS